MFQSFWTDKSGQTVQTQIRLLLEEQSDLGLHVCNSESSLGAHSLCWFCHGAAHIYSAVYKTCRLDGKQYAPVIKAARVCHNTM